MKSNPSPKTLQEILAEKLTAIDLKGKFGNNLKSLVTYAYTQGKLARDEEIMKWAIENGITDKKSFVALRNFLTSKQ